MVKYQACLHLQLNTSEQMGWIQIIEEKHDKIMSIDILRIKNGRRTSFSDNIIDGWSILKIYSCFIRVKLGVMLYVICPSQPK